MARSRTKPRMRDRSVIALTVARAFSRFIRGFRCGSGAMA
jgi:hypothetical protein